ncbi:MULTISPECIES: class I SAM-dependent methyltransferase [unclassified Mycobacterium]|uniref:class I SAM-dependent methyltransferase n=1 Tax=unclassified Mycobacterium TaxID=2642494 RepID=UPI0008015EB4|nr:MULTISPECIES: class I SAM-dependent methyltransferase [unclassified Mycobacterium]OBG99643.1 SAM-dependent methyltransferase [Mycobacterium sp. E2699]OBI47819.1 SAM-dependent methyltransferase [Mycobacterium sp. E787]
MTDVDASLPPSLRTAGDSWAITELVGATALGVAAARAVETAGADPLIHDEFARLLVSSAGPAWERLADPELAWLDGDPEGKRAHRLGIDYQAVRTHYFDDYFASAVAAGIRQVVVLAAGLDSRAYRLTWPPGTAVYEIDQPKVLEYKTGILEQHGAVPAATRRPVPIDLRDDWPAALTDAGFDRARPTAWLAEGLLPYLPSDAQDRLFEMFTALSAPGSQVAVEVFGMNSRSNSQRWLRMRERLGLDVNVQALTYHEPDRTDPVAWLADHGWRVAGVDNRDEMARLGRPVPDDLADEAVRSTLLRARLGGPAD